MNTLYVVCDLEDLITSRDEEVAPGWAQRLTGAALTPERQSLSRLPNCHSASRRRRLVCGSAYSQSGNSAVMAQGLESSEEVHVAVENSLLLALRDQYAVDFRGRFGPPDGNVV